MNKLFLVISGLCLLFFMCNGNNIAGGSTDTELAKMIVTGHIYTKDSLAADKAVVQLFKNNYNPVTKTSKNMPLIDTTDDKGFYTFAVADSGRYNIVATHQSKHNRSLELSIPIFNKTNVVERITLKMTGAIQILLPDTINPSNGYIYVPGTDYFSFLDVNKIIVSNNKKYIIIDSLPADTIPSIYYGILHPGAISSKLYSTFIVTAGDTIILDSSTGNLPLIKGTIFMPDGALAPDVNVYLIPQKHNPIDSLVVRIVITDQNGNFIFKNCKPATYIIQAISNIILMHCMKFDIVVTKDTIVESNDTLSKPDEALLPNPTNSNTLIDYLYVLGNKVFQNVLRTKFLAIYNKNDRHFDFLNQDKMHLPNKSDLN